MFVLVGFVPSYCCTYSWILCEVGLFFYIYTVFRISFRCSLQTVLFVVTFNRYVHCFHVVVGLLFRNLVARKVTVIMRWSLMVVCRCWVARRL